MHRRRHDLHPRAGRVHRMPGRQDGEADLDVRHASEHLGLVPVRRRKGVRRERGRGVLRVPPRSEAGPPRQPGRRVRPGGHGVSAERATGSRCQGPREGEPHRRPTGHEEGPAADRGARVDPQDRAGHGDSFLPERRRRHALHRDGVKVDRHFREVAGGREEAMTIRFIPNPTPCGRSRREFFWQVGGGFAGLALIDLLARDGYPAHFDHFARADEEGGPLAPKKPHFPAKAKHAVFLFMNGAPSQVDTFDPKPALEKYDGKPYRGDTPVGSNGRPIGHLMKSPFPFTPNGVSGLPISSLFPNIARYADDFCVIRALHTDAAAHASGCLQMNTGSVLIGRPCLGSWLSYGLGTESDELPSFVVMTDPRGGPIGGASNWTAGYMPAVYQGTLFRGQGPPLLDLATPEGITPADQRRDLDLLGELNRAHLLSHPDETELASRIASYELAYRMQTNAAEAVDLDREDAAT